MLLAVQAGVGKIRPELATPVHEATISGKISEPKFLIHRGCFSNVPIVPDPFLKPFNYCH